MSNDFTIDKIAWHTQVENTESRESVINRFHFLCKFLDENSLTVKRISPESEFTDDFCIKSSDLTKKGLELIKIAYPKWLTKIDRGMDPSDIRIFEKALLKLK